MLEMLPYTFIRIEIWSIGRKLFYVDSLCPDSRQEITDLFGAMDAPTIPDDPPLLTQVSEPMPQKPSALPSPQRTPAFHRAELSSRGHRAHPRQVRPRQQDFQKWRLAARGVSPHHSRQPVAGG